jgi:hypothetical protein
MNARSNVATAWANQTAGQSGQKGGNRTAILNTAELTVSSVVPIIL